MNNLLDDQKVLKAFLFITYRKRKGIQVVIKFFYYPQSIFFFFLRNYLKKKTENLFFIDNLIWSYMVSFFSDCYELVRYFILLLNSVHDHLLV